MMRPAYRLSPMMWIVALVAGSQWVSELFAQVAPIACYDPRFDTNGDSFVDAEDFRAFNACFTGPGAALPTDPPRCRCFDFQGNGDVDLADYAAFLLCYSGRDAGAERGCDGPPLPNLRPDQRADLAATSITATPPYPFPGEQVDVAVSIANKSQTTNVNGVVVALSANGQKTLARRVDINAGHTDVVHFAWTAGSAGVHALVGAVDPDGELIDNDRGDNVLLADVVVAPPPPSGADLAVSELIVLSPPDEPLRPRSTIRNSGSASAQAPFVFRAVDVAGNPVVTREYLVGPIPPGQAAIIDIAWPGGVLLSRFTAEVNPRYADLEQNPLDNFLVRDFRTPADLYIEALSVFDLRGVPSSRTVSFRVVNGGTSAAGVTHTFVRNVQEQALVDVTTPALSAGETAYVSVPLPTGIKLASEFDLQVEADATNTITETDEFNNLASVHFRRSPSDIHRWVCIGPKLIRSGEPGGAVGRLHSIAVAPSSNAPGSPLIIYVAAPSNGAESCGIWKTTDSGASWRPVADSLPTSFISALAIDPSNISRVYAVAVSGLVFKSEDAGTSWKQISTQALGPNADNGGAFLVDPTNSSRLYLTSMNGVRRSEDGGITWPVVLGSGLASALVMDPFNSAHLYAAIPGSAVTTHESCEDSSVPTTGLYESYDAGDTNTWCKVRQCAGGVPLPSGAAGLAISGQRLYVSFKKPDSWTLYFTTDIGCSIGGRPGRQFKKGWSAPGSTTPCGTPGDDPMYARLWSGLYADPVDPNYVYAQGTDIMRSTDGGTMFRCPRISPHVDHHGFATNPLNNTMIFTMCDGGVYRSNDHGDTWTLIGGGIANVEFYDIGDAPTAPNLVMGGTQDNGNLKYDGNGSTWDKKGDCASGDAATVEIDPTDEHIVYVMGQFSDQICRSTNDDDSNDLFTQGLPGGGDCRNLRYHIHPGVSTTLLAPCGNLYRTTTTEPPGDWRLLAMPASNISQSAVDASVDLYYAGSDSGRLYAGPGGANWRLVFDRDAGVRVTDIEIDLDDPATVYVSLDGTVGGRVYRLRRASAAPQQMDWNNITSNLPTGESVRALAVDRNAPLTIYAATTRSVHRGRSVDGGTTWTWSPYNYGLPSAVDISELEVHATTGVMRAGTHARSAYEVITGPTIGSVLTAEGRVTYFRMNDVGDVYGGPGDSIEGEVVIQLDTWPGKAFGFQLRNDAEKQAHRGMLKILRTAFKNDSRVRIDYVRTGLRNGRVIRVVDLR